MKRRDFIKKAGMGIAAVSLASSFPRVLAGCAAPTVNANLSHKVIVLGIDGMDPALLRRFIAQGRMPVFKKFLESGGLHNLGTSLPPQSPVAWSNFISGAHPGVHGIYDFIARDPETFAPYMALAKTSQSKHTLPIGDLRLPLDSPKTEGMREGPCFWVDLEEAGVDCTVLKIPSNFPVTQTSAKTMSDMGTPDVLGSYGTYNYYTENPPENHKELSGGSVYPVRVFGNIVSTKIYGPANTFRDDAKQTSVPMTIYRDPVASVAKIVIDNSQEIILKQGEWSEWIRVKFDLLGPMAGASGIFRIYMQKIHDGFSMYMTPIQIDPENPAMPITTPNNYAREVSRRMGTNGYYTQGFPEDTKTLSHEIFSCEEYMDQADLVLEERKLMFETEFNRFNEGLFFFYFGSVDQNTHMLWKNMDKNHPLYEPDASSRVKNGVRHYYESMEDVLKQTLAKVDDNTTLMIMSDHGFAPFYKEVNINSWLAENEYISIADQETREEDLFACVDWKKTKAYGLGLNSLYLNLKDREKDGSVSPSEAKALATEIATKLEGMVDPDNGERVITKAYVSNEKYTGAFPDRAPDIVVGFNRGYRVSDSSALGSMPHQILVNREDPWAGDHCIDPSTVSGVFMSNREINTKSPKLYDIAPSIMQAFGLEPDKRMTGKKILK